MNALVPFNPDSEELFLPAITPNGHIERVPESDICNALNEVIRTRYSFQTKLKAQKSD